MKKTLAILLVIAMLAAWLPALAEDSTQTYQNVTFGYSIDYTNDWMLMDSSSIDSYAQQIRDGSIALEGLTPTALYAIQIAFEQAVPDSLILLTDRLGNVIDVTCSDLPTPSDMQLVQQGVAPLLVSLFSTMYTDLEVIDSGSIVTFGNRSFLRQEFQINTNEISNDVTIFYYFQNDFVYCITFTWVPTDSAVQAEQVETIEMMMNSFKLLE